MLSLRRERTHGEELPKRIRELTSTRVDATVPETRIYEPRNNEMFSEDESLEVNPTERRKLKRVVFNLPEPSLKNITRRENKLHGIETDNQFEEPETSLMLIDGNINGIKARILVDTGATLNHLSKNFCMKHGINIQEEKNRVAVMANNSKEPVDSTGGYVTVSMAGYTENIRFAVNTQKYDVILGKKWATNHNAILHCKDNILQFTYKGKNYEIKTISKENEGEVYVNAMIKDIENGSPTFAVLLSTTGIEQSCGTNSTKKDLQNVFDDFKDVFPIDLPRGLPPSRIEGDFKINLKHGSEPVKRKLHRMSNSGLDELKQKIDELLEQGFIRPSTSPWAAPVLFVSKKDGTLRFCVDYRGLNKLTIKNSYPLLRIDEIIDDLGNAKYFSVIDLRSGYHQMRIFNDDIPKTGFNTKFGHFEFTVVPFGLTNAPAEFMSMMDRVLKGYIGEFVIAYLDDILVYSTTWDEHIEHIRKVLQKLRDHKLFAKLSKCTFGVKEVEYLGFVLKGGKLAMKETKTKAITAWEVPRSKRELQAFLGLGNYYRRFIRGFSKIARPLTDLTKDVPFT